METMGTEQAGQHGVSLTSPGPGSCRESPCRGSSSGAACRAPWGTEAAPQGGVLMQLTLGWGCGARGGSQQCVGQEQPRVCSGRSPLGGGGVLCQLAYPLHPGIGPQGVLHHKVPEHLHPRVVLRQVVVVLGRDLPHLWRGPCQDTHAHGTGCSPGPACGHICVPGDRWAHAVDTHTYTHHT